MDSEQFASSESVFFLNNKYCKTCVKQPLKKKTKNWLSRQITALCRSKVLQNAPREHSAILSNFIKLPFVFKACVLSIFERPLQTGFTVQSFFKTLMIYRVIQLKNKLCSIQPTSSL